jgi:Family of unknown function (DUF5677)
VISEYFLYKATKTLDAICLLCDGRFAQDAMILGRTILELCIHLWSVAAADTAEQRQQRAESLIYDGERQRVEMFTRLKKLKEQGKCLLWIDDLEAQHAAFETVNMPPTFARPKSLKDTATQIGGEIECWYHIIYWSVSNLIHPSSIGSHSYIGAFDQEEEIARALIAVNIHFSMTIAALSLLELERLRPPLEEAMKQFVALSQQP